MSGLKHICTPVCVKGTDIIDCAGICRILPVLAEVSDKSEKIQLLIRFANRYQGQIARD